MNKTVQEWFGDPKFRELSSADKERAIGNFFDREVATQPGPGAEPFESLPEHQRQQTRENFVRMNLDPNRPAPPSRGVVGDIGASLGRGALGAGEMVVRAAAGLDTLVAGEDAPLAPSLREIGKDIAGYRDDTIPVSREAQADPVRKAWTGGVESATTSLLAVAPVVTLGALTGGAGAAAAGYLMGAPMFGLAQYDQSLDEFTRKGVPKDEAHMAALMMGASEAGFEFVTDALEIATVGFGGLVTKPLKDAAKNSVKRTITSSWKEAAKRGLAVAGTETAGESMNVGAQAEIEKGAGVGDERFWGAVKDQFGQVAVAGLIFGAIGGGLHKARSSHVKGLITDKDADPEERLGAVQEIYGELARTDPGLADRWRTGATMAVLQGHAISDDIEDVQAQPQAAPVGAAGEDTTKVGSGPAAAGKKKKTAAEILTGRTAPSRQPSVEPEEELAAGAALPPEEETQARTAAETITGRRAPMRQPSPEPVETASQAPAEAVQEPAVVEDVGKGALPEVVEETGAGRTVQGARQEQPSRYKHFTTAERAAGIRKAGYQSEANEPLWGTGGLDAGPKVGRFAGNAIYLSRDDEKWGNLRAFKPEGEPRPATDTDSTENGEMFFDYEKQAWMFRPGKWQSVPLEAVEFDVAKDARILAIDSEEALDRAINKYGFWDSDEFWQAVKQDYDAVSIGKTAENLEAKPDHKFFKSAMADQMIVLNKDKVSVVGQADQILEDEKTAAIARDEIDKEESRDEVAARAAESSADILNKDGKPYANVNAARFARRGKKLDGSHDVVAVTGGYALRPRAGQSPIGKAAQESKPAAAATDDLSGIGKAGKKIWKEWIKRQGTKPGDRDHEEAFSWFEELYNAGKSGRQAPTKNGGMPIAYDERQAYEAGREDAKPAAAAKKEDAGTERTVQGAQTKEPWEMTRREYVESVSEGIAVDDRAYGRHKTIVSLALGEGKPVPSEVLADYPDLVEKPKTDVAEVLTGKPAKPGEAKDMADWAAKMMSRGAARIGAVDYSVQQAGTGSFYYRRTENGVRSEKGPGYPAKWTRKQAIIEAAKKARQDFERGQREQEKEKPVEGAAADQAVEAGPAADNTGLKVEYLGPLNWTVVDAEGNWLARFETEGEAQKYVDNAAQAAPEKARSARTSPTAAETITGRRPSKSVAEASVDDILGEIDRQVAERTTPKERMAESADKIKAGMARIAELARQANAVFDEKGQLSEGEFDENRWNKLKPIFSAMWQEAQALKMNVKEFVSAVLDQLGVQAAGYFKRWAKEEFSEKTLENAPKQTIIEGEAQAPTQEVADEDRDRTTGQGALEGEPSENVPGAEGERGPGSVPAEPAAGGEPGAGRPADEGAAAPRSDGDRNVPLRVRPERRRGSGSRNYRIPDGESLEPGGKVAKFTKNVAAIKLLKQLESESRQATPEEQAVLAQFTGWGGIPEAFNKYNYREPAWNTRAAELEDLLTDEEYESARSSTPNAHYTSPETVDFIYRVLTRLGVTGGKVLEPGMGSGIFLGRIPSKWNAQLTGVEMELITGRIAKQLYPEANVHVKRYEETTLPDNFFDVAVGNVPFADVRPYDPRYKDQRFQLHDYFFAKSLDKVRPGGIVAFITSTGTMDKKDRFFRDWIAARAELVGAFRLPRTAFKGIADTEVTTDIIILKKRPEIKTGQDLINQLDEIAKKKNITEGVNFWRETVEQTVGTEKAWDGSQVEQKADINEYYEAHPENMFGTLRPDKLWPRRAGLEPKPDKPLADDYKEALQRLPKNIITHEPHKSTEAAAPEELTDAPDDIKELTIYHESVSPGGKVVHKFYQKVNGKAVKIDVPESQGPRIRSLISLRGTLRQVLNNQILGRDETLKADLDQLNRVYDNHVSRFGPIHGDVASRRIMAEDPEFPRLLALEKWDKNTKSAEKTDIFNRKTIQRYVPITKAETPDQALFASLIDRGRVDIEHIAGLLGVTENEAADQLYGQVFLDPETRKYTTSDDYLSGNVRRKLAAARAALENEQGDAERARWQANVEALEKNQPKDLTATEINAKLGSPWIPTEYVDQFLIELVRANGIKTYYSPQIATWVIEKQGYGSDRQLNFKKWGTDRASAVDLVEDALNMRQPKIYDRVNDKSVFNPKATMLAQAKQSDIKKHFRNWIWQDAARREVLLKHYNENFNAEVLPRYDGSHLPETLPGMNPDIKLRPWQKDAVWQILHGGNALLDHYVGAGKTFIMAAAAMELKRLRMATKPMIAVPKSIIRQFERSIRLLYPTANVLVADVSSEKRKETMARIATGDWDAVLVTHPQFEMLPMSRPAQEAFMRGQIVELENAIRAAEEDAGGGGGGYSRRRKKSGNRIVKEMEKAKERLQARLKEMLDQPKDQTVDFEELGVDYLFVDEAHRFKNLFFTSKMARIPGVGANKDVNKTMDMLLKTDHIRRVNNGRGVVFATGTPISNSVSEMYTMMRYLAPDMMRELGINNFDAWAGTLGDTVTDYEITPTGAGFREHTRFTDFSNLWELQTLYRKFTNVFSEADLRASSLVEIPKRVGDKIDVEGVEASEYQRQYVKHLDQRMDAIKTGKVDPREDNALKVTTDGIKCALDMRLLDAEAPDLPGSKLNKCVDNVVRVWKESESRRGTQIVFCDISRPDKTKFNVYDDIKKKLIEAGIPAKEIAFIHDAGNSDERRAELIRKLRDAEIRVMLGSTQMLGEGVNAQQKMVGVHHLDAPWKPAEIEQRNGRAFRQGNENSRVYEFRYVTKGTFDAYRWQILEIKAKFISKIKSERVGRTLDGDFGDVVLDAATVKAIASGNPKVLEHVRAKGELAVLEAEHSAWQEQQWNYQRNLNPESMTALPAQLKRAEKTLESWREGEAVVKRNPLKEDEFKVDVGGKTLAGDKETKKAAEAELFKQAKQATVDGKDSKGRKIAEYRGVEFVVMNIEPNGGVDLDPGYGTSFVQLRPYMAYKDETTGGRAYMDLLVRHVEEGIPRGTKLAESHVEDLKREIENSRKALDEPFAKQAQLEENRRKVAMLEKELSAPPPGAATATGPSTYFGLTKSGEWQPLNDAEIVQLTAWAQGVVHPAIEDESLWSVTDPESGVSISRGHITRGEAIEVATNILEKHGEDEYRAAVQDAIKESPPKPNEAAPSGDTAESGQVDFELAKPAGKIAGADIPLEDVQKVFPGQKVTQDKNGIWITTKGGRQLWVRSVDHIDVDQATVDAYFGREMSPGDTFTARGAYVRGRGAIRLSRNKGTNAWVLRHETVHWMEDAGILSKSDIRALRNKIEQEVKAGRWEAKNPNDIGGKEDRANWIRQELANREAHRGALRRILDTVADLLDTIVNLFKVTARGVVREIESGRVYERKGDTLLGIEGNRFFEGRKGIAAGTPLPQGQEYDIVDDVLPAGVADRYRDAQGAGKPKLLAVIREKAKMAAATFTPGRMFPKMPNRYFGRENVLLREFMEAGDYGRARAIMELKDILDPKNLKAEDYKLFGLKLVLDDMQKDMEPGGVLEDWPDLVANHGEIAFGFKSKDEVDDALAKIDAALARQPEAAAAIARRLKAIGDLRKQLVKENMLPEQVLNDERYFHHQVLEYANAKRFAGVDQKAGEVRVRKAGWQYARTGSIKEYNTKYLESEFEVLAQGFERLARKQVLDEIGQHANIMPALRATAKKANKAAFKAMLKADPQLKAQYDSLPSEEKGAFRKKALGKNYKTWRHIMKQMAPRTGSTGWAEWVPRPGTAWYMTNSINDQILGEVLAGNRQLEAGDVRPVLARGADVRWVIPAELAEVMDGADFQKSPKDNVVSQAAETTMNMWKRWILINPLRVIKYNLNNTSGDLDITLAYDPRILRHAGRAIRDLWAYHYDRDMSPALKDEFKTALKNGVIGGITAHDIPDIGKMADFRQLERAMGARDNVAIDLIQRFWHGSKNFTQFRENVLRLAAFRYFKERVAAGDRVYGASLPNKVNAIDDAETDRKAGLLARELIGDYGGLSKGGRWLRRKLIPFYSWMEINAPRYWRLMRNISIEGEPAGRRVALLGAVAGKKAAFLGAKAFMLYGAIALWNALVFPDEEEELGEEGRRQMHLILGRRADGSIMTLRLQGALSDALSWFNLHDFPEDMRELASGKKTVYQWMGQSAREPVNKLLQGIRPDIKGFGELIGGKTIYPDFTRPRPIRDRGEYVARMLSLEGFYRRAAGRPMKEGTVTGQVWEDVLRTFSYSANPGETAYYGAREMVGKFLEERNIERQFHEPTDRSNALYWYKTAIKYGDAEAAERYLKKYKELGGTMKGLKISVDRAHPLASLPKKYRTKFLNGLSDEDRETVKRAGRWYKETFKR